METEQPLSGYPAAQSKPRAETCRPSQESAWPACPRDRDAGERHHHREDFVSCEASTVWQECGPSGSRDVHRQLETPRGLARAAPWWKYPRIRPNCRNSVTAAASMGPSPCGSAGMRATVASQRSATSRRPFWPPISIPQISFPRMPGSGTPPAGKVGNPACGQHTSNLSNARERGRDCPEA